jgi:hypothetical protein
VLSTPNPAAPLRTPPSPHAAPRIEGGEIIVITPSESKPRGDS